MGQVYRIEESTTRKPVRRWLTFLVFYFFFYSGLILFWAVCMKALLMTLDETEPKYLLQDSLIGTNPGLTIRPRITHDGTIRYNPFNPENVAEIEQHLENFLSDYSTNILKENVESCSPKGSSSPEMICYVDPNNFGPCTPQNKFGYNTQSPCVFLKLNKIFGWHSYEEKIWVDCMELSSAKLIEAIHFYPDSGFPAFYFPYLNQKNYLSPLIAVQLHNLKHETVANVECKVWAPNINSTVRFQISSEGVIPN